MLQKVIDFYQRLGHDQPTPRLARVWIGRGHTRAVTGSSFLLPMLEPRLRPDGDPDPSSLDRSHVPQGHRPLCSVTPYLSRRCDRQPHVHGRVQNRFWNDLGCPSLLGSDLYHCDCRPVDPFDGAFGIAGGGVVNPRQPGPGLGHVQVGTDSKEGI